MTAFKGEYFLMIECGNLAALTLCHPKMQIQDQQRQLSISQWCCAHHLRAAFCAQALWTSAQEQAHKHTNTSTQAQVHKCVRTSTPAPSTSTPLHKCSGLLRAPRKVLCDQIDPLPPFVSVLLIELITSPMATFGGFELLFALLVLTNLHHHLNPACIIMNCTMIAIETSFDRAVF